MMKQVKWLFLFWLFSMACNPVRVKNTQSSPGFSLQHYQTFGFYEVSSEGQADDLTYKNQIMLLKDAIAGHLNARGLRQEPVSPDLLVNIGVVTREKVQTRETNFRTDAPRYIGQRRYSWKSQEVEVGRYKQGTVTIDLVDREKNSLMWSGVMEAIIPKKESRLQKTIKAGISELFSHL